MTARLATAVSRHNWQTLLLSFAGGVLLLFFALPLAALLLRVSPSTILGHVTSPVIITALQLSLLTSLFSTALTVLFGTPLAYVMARRAFTGKRLVEALVHVPLVLPPAVAGLALLMAFGRRGLIGGMLEGTGIELSFSTAAVVLAQTFVASPFYIRSAQAGFAQVDPTFESLSATLGVGPWRTFCQITAPLALPALVGGSAMAWARALGEFGATIMFAGNFPGRSQTMPLAVYTALQSDLDAAIALSVVMLAISFVVLIALHVFAWRGNSRA